MRCWRRVLLTVCVSLVLVSSVALAQLDDPQPIAKSDPLTPAEELKTFHLPPGFEMQLVAAEPEVRKPINLNFDARGRLYVTQSGEYPFPAKPGVKPLDRVSGDG